MNYPYNRSPATRLYPDLHLDEHEVADASEEREGAWLVSFVDVLTLLLTLFVLLLAYNHLSQRQVMPKPVTPPPVVIATPAPIKSQPTPTPAPAFTIPQDIRNQVDLKTSPGKVNLVIKDDVLFDEGSSSLKAGGAAVLERIARLLKENNYPISVEGHTDNIPIHTAQFPSNWELSSYRATMVTRYFIEHGIAVNRLRATGYADTHPIADNATAEGRARNRRVSLVIHVNANTSPHKNPDAAPKPD